MDTTGYLLRIRDVMHHAYGLFVTQLNALLGWVVESMCKVDTFNRILTVSLSYPVRSMAAHNVQSIVRPRVPPIKTEKWVWMQISHHNTQILRCLFGPLLLNSRPCQEWAKGSTNLIRQCFVILVEMQPSSRTVYDVRLTAYAVDTLDR